MDNVNIIFVNIHYVFLEQGPNNVGQLQSNCFGEQSITVDFFYGNVGNNIIMLCMPIRCGLLLFSTIHR